MDDSRISLEWEAARTVARLFYHLDGRDYRAVALLFAPDGTWRRQGRMLTGPNEIADALAGRPASLTTRHLVSNLLLEADPAGVMARYYITVFEAETPGDGPAPLAAPSAIFVSEDRLIQVPAGLRFASRAPTLAFRRQ